MRILGIAVISIVMMTSCMTEKTESIPPKPFPIHAWIGPPASETSMERYQELADAGFNSSFSPFPNNDEMADALDIAQACNIMLFVNTPELRGDTEGTVRRFMDHPALHGYHLKDEPGADEYPALAEWVQRIHAVDSAHPCYINLFPNYADSAQLDTLLYRDYVSRYIEEVPVQFISFDHYPVLGHSLRPEWYENLEIVSDAARAAGKPFWAFALAVAHDPYPIPTMTHLRLQVYSNLVYGAQGIQYFTYWTPQSDRWNFHEAPIKKNGERSAVYDLVKKMNQEIQGLSGVFAGAQVESVGHLGELPNGVRPYGPHLPCTEIEVLKSKGGVVSHLTNDGRSYLAIVNSDLCKSMTLRITFDAECMVSSVGKAGILTPIESSVSIYTITPGDLLLFTWITQ